MAFCYLLDDCPRMARGCQVSTPPEFTATLTGPPGEWAHAPDLKPDWSSLRTRSTHVRQVMDSAALMRGVDEYGRFRAEPRPERDMHPVPVAMQAEAARRQARILYSGTGRRTFRPDI
jgi:hypothetical protein